MLDILISTPAADAEPNGPLDRFYLWLQKAYWDTTGAILNSKEQKKVDMIIRHLFIIRGTSSN